VRIALEIQRHSGNETRRVTPGDGCGVVDGACPGCGAEPFRVLGCEIEPLSARGFCSGGVSACCRQNVGYLRAEPETIFGTEEDRAVLEFGRARVYGGGLRP
jgi:hypothetical protein